VVLGRKEGIAWRTLPKKLVSCQFLVEEDYLKYIPKKSTFHKAWDEIRQASLERWIIQLGNDVAKLDTDAVAIDSTGFELYGGSSWRLVKWVSGLLRRTSKLFRKIHIGVALPSRAIIGIRVSKSKSHDAHEFGRLWLSIPKRLLTKVRKIYADKAYWWENILGLIAQEGMVPVIPPKSNSVDHGTSKARDLVVRAHQNYPGLYRHNHQPQRRAAVEHVFGLIKLRPGRITDRKLSCKNKTLLSRFLWYNHNLRVKRVRW